MVQVHYGERLANHTDPESYAFTSDRVAVLASQATISLENASLYSDLQRSETFLAEAQSLSHTGSFGWSVRSGEIYWSAETYNIFEHGRAAKPTLEMVLQRIHPDDRDLVQKTLVRPDKELRNGYFRFDRFEYEIRPRVDHETARK
jgi:hypothetical protein